MKYSVKASRQPSLAVPATQFTLPGEASPMVGRNGEINASSNRDLLKRSCQFMMANSEGLLKPEEVVAQNQRMQADAKIHGQAISAAFNDSDTHRILGEVMADSLFKTANRQGFMRKFLANVEVKQGAIPRFPLRMKNVTAVWSTSPTRIATQVTRDPWFTPPEFQIVARPFVTRNEINQSSGDVLQEKFVEATEALMVKEDRHWYNQVNALVGVDNKLNNFGTGLTPTGIMQVQSQVTRWGLKAAHVLLASDLFIDIVGNAEFGSIIDPVARHELLLTGQLGTIYGMLVTSDAYRFPEHKVLNRGEFFVISDPLTHGAYSDRNGITSEPISITTENIPGRGWVMEESVAIAVCNSLSVAKGVRL